MLLYLLLMLPIAAETQEEWINAPGLHPVEQQMLDAVNSSRQRNGRPALKPEMGLVRGSRRHAHWMARNRNMSHAGGVQENIAMGQSTVGNVQNTWMNSSGHRSNILSGATHFGGSVCRSKSNGRLYWCQRFKRYKAQ